MRWWNKRKYSFLKKLACNRCLRPVRLCVWLITASDTNRDLQVLCKQWLSASPQNDPDSFNMWRKSNYSTPHLALLGLNLVCFNVFFFLLFHYFSLGKASSLNLAALVLVFPPYRQIFCSQRCSFHSFFLSAPCLPEVIFVRLLNL